ncbi:hypothetical protein ACA910_010043 [Epithemia clementina (nom. ined.)]
MGDSNNVNDDVNQQAQAQGGDDDDDAAMDTIDPLMFRSSDLPDLFADVVPVPQDDGPDVVCCIDYPAGFQKVYDYFRAILKRHEISPRVFGLTSLCLHHNPANYTVWHVRRQCFSLVLSSLSASHPNQENEGLVVAVGAAQNSLLTNAQEQLFTRELEYTANLGGSNPKNYQIWYHRRTLLDKYCTRELSYIDSVLEIDAKNYHAWSHRQWFVLAMVDKKPSFMDLELAYTTELIDRDIRNNSAWNHRWFVLHNQYTNDYDNESESKQQRQQQRLPFHVVESEAHFALDQILLDPYNESSCRFLVALLKEAYQQEQPRASTLIRQYLESLQNQVLVDEQYPDASPVLSACADLYEWLQQPVQATPWLMRLSAVDPIRTKYWMWRLEQIAAASTATTAGGNES